jgi:hypothetical protein
MGSKRRLFDFIAQSIYSALNIVLEAGYRVSLQLPDVKMTIYRTYDHNFVQRLA